MPSPSRELASLLIGLGALGIITSVAFGVGGWLLVDRLTDRTIDALQSTASVVDDVGVATESAALALSSLSGVVESVEEAARSTGQTLSAVQTLLGEVSETVRTDIVAGVEGASDAMPGIIASGRVADRTLRALSLVGVDYDPDVPLDEALSTLDDSLAPLPDEIREQADLVDGVADDLVIIGNDARTLATRLLVIQLELRDAEDLLAGASANVSAVQADLRGVASEVEDLGTWAPWVFAALAVAIASVASGLLAIGIASRTHSTDLEQPVSE